MASHQHHTPHVKKKICRVRSIYDGDTLSVEWEDSSWFGLKQDIHPVKVRLAYIDTPELRYKQAGAVQAKELLEKLLSGRRIVVEYEELPTGGIRRCDYNRVLAVIHLQRTFLPNLNINELLLRKGLARLYSHPDNVTPHHVKRFARAEQYAKRRNLGLWRDTDEQQLRKWGRVFWYIFVGIVVGIIIGMALAG